MTRRIVHQLGIDEDDDDAPTGRKLSPVELHQERMLWLQESPRALARRIPVSVFALAEIAPADPAPQLS